MVESLKRTSGNLEFEPYLALYQINRNALMFYPTIAEPEGLCWDVTVYDKKLTLTCQLLNQGASYTGWCRAKIVYAKGDYEDFEYFIKMQYSHGMHPERGSDRVRLELVHKSQEGNILKQIESDFEEINQGADLAEELGVEGASTNILLVDYAKHAPPLRVSLESRPVGALAEYLAENGKFDAEKQKIKSSLGTSKAQKELLIQDATFRQLNYTKELLGELIVDMVIGDYELEQLEAIVKRHLRFMNMGDMQALTMGIILGEEADEKKAELLNEQTLKLMGKSGLTGAERSQVLKDITVTAESISKTN